MHKTCILFYCFIFFRWFLSDVPSHGKEKLLSGNTHGYSASGASAPLHALLLRGLLLLFKKTAERLCIDQ